MKLAYNAPGFPVKRNLGLGPNHRRITQCLRRKTMNTNERIVVAVFSLALAALLLLPLTAMARAVANVHIPVSGVVFNPCNGETVTFNGIDHFTATVTLD